MLMKTTDSDEPLPGAVFGLFDEQGNKVQEAVSDADGIVLFSKIPYGTYTIRELSAPSGYHASDEEWSIVIDGTYVNLSKLLATVNDGVISMMPPSSYRFNARDHLMVLGHQADIEKLP